MQRYAKHVNHRRSGNDDWNRTQHGRRREIVWTHDRILLKYFLLLKISILGTNRPQVTHLPFSHLIGRGPASAARVERCGLQSSTRMQENRGRVGGGRKMDGGKDVAAEVACRQGSQSSVSRARGTETQTETDGQEDKSKHR